MNVIQDYYKNEFDPRSYLEEYFSTMHSENLDFLKFFVRVFQDVPPNAIMLDFACGPTIYSWITASTKVQEIHAADYLPVNLQEVKKWLQNDADAWDRNPFIKTAMEFENAPDCSAEAIDQRASQIRQCVTKTMHSDATLPKPLGENQQTYDIVLDCFCAAEASGGDYKKWRDILKNITSLLKPNGKFALLTMYDGDAYTVLGKEFPITNVNESLLRGTLEELGFDPTRLVIEDIAAREGELLYRGILLATGIKASSP